MKEVIKVSISGVAFTFDDDAYKVMNDYLKKLEAGYAKHPDGREIVADIEARVAELILEHQESDKVIGIDLARSIVDQLGYPDDMDQGKDIPVEELPRRFYRNPEGAKLAGICSGMGAYFRIDPVWIRLGLFAPLLLGIIGSSFRWGSFWYSLFGVVLLLYLILWIVVPMAKTPRQKLEMRGEKITADSIRQTFEDEASAISGSEKSRKNASVWADIVYVLGRILQIFLKVIVFFIAFAFGIVGISLLIAIVAVIFGASSVTVMGLSLTGASMPAYAIVLILIMLIPIFVLVYWLAKMAFSSKTNRPFLITVWTIWTIMLIWFVATTARNADVLRYEIRDIIERIDDGRIDDYIDRWEERYDDGRDYILFDSDAKRIRKENGGPLTIEKRDGRKVIMVLPESTGADRAEEITEEILEEAVEPSGAIPDGEEPGA